MIRLVDFNPHWITLNNSIVPFYFGVSFMCPCCRGRRIAVKFWPPVDPDNWNDRITPVPHEGFHSRVSGETFDTLTIVPSIGFEQIGHWHGCLTNGEIQP